jgi:hypothetical protein
MLSLKSTKAKIRSSLSPEKMTKKRKIKIKVTVPIAIQPKRNFLSVISLEIISESD